MRPSQFNVSVDECPTPGVTTIFNCRTLCFARLPKSLHDQIRSAPNLLPIPVIKSLTYHGFLVDDEADEYSVYNSTDAQRSVRPDVLSIMLPMTYTCNCACVYCYLAHVRSRLEHYTAAQAEANVRFVKECIDQHPYKKLEITFHGGEPLLHTDVIGSMGAELRKYCVTRRLTPWFKVVTNATLLTERNLATLRGAQIDWFQITLDGPPETHDSRRPYRSGRPTFNDILANIERAAKESNIQLVVIVDRRNQDKLAQLADILKARGLEKAIRLVSISRVSENLDTPGYCAANCLSHQEVVEIQLRASSIFASRGFNFRSLRMPTAICSLPDAHNLIIDHKGDVYSCSKGVADPRFRVGNVSDGYRAVLDNKFRMGEYLRHDREPCTKCPVLPLCKGGCPYEGLRREGSISHLGCQIEYIRSRIEAWVRLGASGYLSGSKTYSVHS